MNKKVSVIIPTYYRNRELERAIQSVLNQDYSPVEIIVVDGSGEAHAESAVSSYNVKYIIQDEDKGANEARNRGIKESTGEYIQLLDDDDELLEGKVAKQVELLDSSSDVGVAYGGIVTRDGTTRLPTEEPTDDPLRTSLQLNWWTAITSSLLISRDVLMKIHPLPSNLGDDISMRIELATRTEFDFVNEVLTKINDTDNNKSGRIEFMDERERVINNYQQLYEEYPASVHRNAVGYAYRKKAFVIINHNFWSPLGTWLFIKSLYLTKGVDIKLIFAIMLSLFGRPGMRFGHWVNDSLNKKVD